MADQADASPADKADKPTDRKRFLEMVLGFRSPLLDALKDLQPLVVLFSLSIVVATFTKASFPEASDWSLVAGFGFGLALVFFATLSVAKPQRPPGLATVIVHLYAYMGVLLGFISLGLALIFLLLRNDLLNRGILFVLSSAVSMGSLLLYFETRDFVREMRHRVPERGNLSVGWSILGWANAIGISLAAMAPPFVFLRSPEWSPWLPEAIWLIGLGIVVVASRVPKLAPRL